MIGVQHGAPVDKRLIQLVTLRTADAGKVFDLLLNLVNFSNHGYTVPSTTLRNSHTDSLTSIYNSTGIQTKTTLT